MTSTKMFPRMKMNHLRRNANALAWSDWHHPNILASPQVFLSVEKRAIYFTGWWPENPQLLLSGGLQRDALTSHTQPWGSGAHCFQSRRHWTPHFCVKGTVSQCQSNNSYFRAIIMLYGDWICTFTVKLYLIQFTYLNFKILRQRVI